MNLEEIINKVMRIADHHGLDEQILQCSEECAELTVALSKLRRGLSGKYPHIGVESARCNVAEECGDVIIMLTQIMYLAGISEESVFNFIVEKVNRELERIKNEKKINHLANMQKSRS